MRLKVTTVRVTGVLYYKSEGTRRSTVQYFIFSLVYTNCGLSIRMRFGISAGGHCNGPSEES